MSTSTEISGEVLRFIDRFTDGGAREQVTETFTNGCCYWFAHVLYNRFWEQNEVCLMYDIVWNHFGTRIEDRVYDITGDVTEQYVWRPWAALGEEECAFGSIVRDCINF